MKIKFYFFLWLIVVCTHAYALAQKETIKLLIPIGHTFNITSVCFSPNGKYCLSGSWDKTMKLWETNTGRELKTFTGHLARVNSACFSPDGKYCLSGSYDNTIKLWDATTGEEIRTFEENSHPIISVCFSPPTPDNPNGGKFCLSGSEDGSIKLWDIATGKEIRSFNGHSGEITCVCFTKNGKYCFSGSKDNTVKQWEVATGREIRCFNEHTSDITAVCVSPNGKFCVSTSLYESMILWNVETGKKIKNIKTDEYWMTSVCFSPAFEEDTIGGKSFISGSSEGIITLWNGATGNKIMTFEGHPDNNLGIHALCFSPDGKYCLSGSCDWTMTLWSISSGKRIRTFEGVRAQTSFACFSPIGSINSTEKKHEFISTSRLTMKLWNALDGKEIRTFEGYTDGINSVCFSPDGKCCLTGACDSTLKLWDVTSGKRIRTFNGHKSWVKSVCFSSDGKYCLSGSLDKTMKMWDVTTGKEIRSFNGHTWSVESVCFSSDEKYCLSGSLDGKMKLWNTFTGKEIKSFDCSGWVTSVSFTPDGKFCLSGSTYPFSDKPYQDTLKLWDVATGKEVRTFGGHSAIFNSFCFSPACEYDSTGGNYFLGSGYNNTIIMWSVVTGTIIKIFNGHLHGVNSVSFSSDGKYFISSSDDKTIRLWSIQTGNEIISFIPMEGNDYVDLLPSKYYRCSKGSVNRLYYVKGLQTVGFDQLDVKYNRPDKVMQALGMAFGQPDTALIYSYYRAWQKRIKKLGVDTSSFEEGFSVPESDFKNRDGVSYEQLNDSLTLKLWSLDSIYKLDRFNIWVNQVPVYGQNGVNIRSRNLNQIDTTITIKLSEGENKIETSALNINGIESYRVPLNVNYKPAQPQSEKIYFIGIGINKFNDSINNLRWSVKDIQDLSEKLKEKNVNNIEVHTLFDEQVNSDNVLALKKILQQTKVDDKVIIAYSGHGLISKSYDYYLSTYNVNFNKPEEGGLPFDDLEWLLDSIPARKKLMLIDACHSGELDKEEIISLNKFIDSAATADVTHKGVTVVNYGNNKTLGLKNSFELMQELFANVSRGTGATILSAAAGTQFAIEDAKQQNGYFTYSILELMRQKENVKVSELKNYVSKRVEQLSDGMQKPTSRTENIEFDWNVW
ncbi:MAG: caspase family protein [Bacteroidia bacterium]